MDSFAPALLRLLEATTAAYKRRLLARIERRLERDLRGCFRAQAKQVGRAFKRLAGGWPRAQQESYRLEEVEAIDADLAALFAADNSGQAFEAAIGRAARSGLSAGAASVVAQLALDYSFNLKNPRAVVYLEAHGAELVKKISETTRADIQRIVSYALENGWSYNRTAAAIQRQFRDYYTGDSWWNFDAPRAQLHIDSRAHLIAVTEAGNAYEAGAAIPVDDLQAAGIEMEKYWSSMGDERVSQGCRDNQAQGWIPVDQAHASGHMHPLRFPGCRCDELYRRKGDETA